MATLGSLRSSLLPGWMPSSGLRSISAPKFDALAVTASQLQERLTAGSLTSTDIVEEYISRINEHNGYLKAVYVVAPGVVQQAKALDEKRAKGTFLGPLHGIPVLLKVISFGQNRCNYELS